MSAVYGTCGLGLRYSIWTTWPGSWPHFGLIVLWWSPARPPLHFHIRTNAISAGKHCDKSGIHCWRNNSLIFVLPFTRNYLRIDQTPLLVGQANLYNNNKNIDTRILKMCACLYFVCSYLGLCSVFCVFCGCGCGWLMVVLDKKLRQCSREWPLIRIIRSTTWLTSKWSGSRRGARQHPLWKPLNILTSVSWGRCILKAAFHRFLPDHCSTT